MGLFDSIWINAECPNCKNKGIYEFQTKELGRNLIHYKKGDKIPNIHDDRILQCISSCNEGICKEQAYNRLGYHSGFGLVMYGDIIIEKGIIVGVKNVVMKHND